MRQRRIVLYVLANFVAVSHRHEYVSQHQVRPQVGNLAYRGLTVANGNHLYPVVFQGQTYHLLDIAVVVRNQNPGHRTSSGRYNHPHTTAQRIGAFGLTRVNVKWEPVCRKVNTAFSIPVRLTKEEAGRGPPLLSLNLNLNFRANREILFVDLFFSCCWTPSLSQIFSNRLCWSHPALTSHPPRQKSPSPVVSSP